MAVDRFKKWTIRILVTVGAIVAVLGLYVGQFLVPMLWSEWEMRHQIRESYEQRLVPATEWVREFANRTGRLPSDEEFEKYSIERFAKKLAILRERPPRWKDKWLDSWPESGNEFVLHDYVPDWALYYCSWNKKRVSAWTD